jgi:hypothetical protein
MTLFLIILAVVVAGGAIAVVRSSHMTRQAADARAIDGSSDDQGAAAGSNAQSARSEPKHRRGGCC